MRIARPKSLMGLILTGFFVVALPLLIGVVRAAIQMGSLAAQSEELVVQGVQAAQNSELLVKAIESMERNARQYNVLADPEFLDIYAGHYAAFIGTISAFSNQPRGEDVADALNLLRRDATLLNAGLRREQPGSPALGTVLDNFAGLRGHADRLSAQNREFVDSGLSELENSAREAQRALLWQTAALIPGTILLGLVFTLLFARPIRQIDRAISELGKGTFSRAIRVHGPSDLQALGRQLEWLRIRLLELAQEKNKFLRHMSHELKTPLANIREGTELLMDGAVGDLDESQREVAAILRDNGIKLQQLIENLLSFSAWQSKSAVLDLSEFPLRPLIREVAEHHRLALVSQKVKLKLQIQDLVLCADRSKLRMVLDNLVSNATKFTPHGGTIHIRSVAFDDKLIIDVADTGPGIPATERGRIFEAFYQGTLPQGGHVQGTGIGLSVVMECVQAHGGTVEIVDGVFSGAHFRIHLPLEQALSSPKVAVNA